MRADTSTEQAGGGTASLQPGSFPLDSWKKVPMSGPATSRRPHRSVGAVLLLGLTVSAGIGPLDFPAGATPKPAVSPANKVFDPYGHQLVSISCANSTFCVGVGDYQGLFNGQFLGGTLAEAWSGSSWGQLDTPNPVMPGFNVGFQSSFSAVSCTSSTFCVAVGNSSVGELVYTLAEVWNGSIWSIQATPDPVDPSELSGVSCTSPTFCMAIGTDARSQPLAEEWDGNTWTQMTVPVPEGTTNTDPINVDCVTETFCVAVGTSSESGSVKSFNLIDEFNGISWSSVDAPEPVHIPQPALTDVSCASVTSCVAIGSGFADVLDGTTWSIEPVPSPSGAEQSALGGVSCISATFCTAVGSYEVKARHWVAQATTWDGASWSPQGTATLTDTKTSGLADVACFSSSSCLAVGSHTVKKQTDSALVEQEVGDAWTLQVSPKVVPLALTPDSGNPGTKVTVSGNGFSPDSSIKVIYNNGNGSTVLCNPTTDADGTYTCTATITKASAGPRGSHDVIAKDEGSLEAVDLFTVT
jgi:hypothetical protein